jgi:hypothetical protein
MAYLKGVMQIENDPASHRDATFGLKNWQKINLLAGTAGSRFHWDNLG